MWQYTVKIVLSAIILVTVSELVKRNSFLAAILASLPITSVVTFIWIYLESEDTQKIAEISHNIFWLVLPSLVLFIILPLLIRHHVDFWVSLAISCIITIVSYFGMIRILDILSINI